MTTTTTDATTKVETIVFVVNSGFYSSSTPWLCSLMGGAPFYVLYRPQRPQFSITFLCIAKLDFTTNSSLFSHLTLLLNLTFSSKNPNIHIVFFYDTFTLSMLSISNLVQLANDTTKVVMW
jgi:hypothetical protein